MATPTVQTKMDTQMGTKLGMLRKAIIITAKCTITHRIQQRARKKEVQGTSFQKP